MTLRQRNNVTLNEFIGWTRAQVRPPTDTTKDIKQQLMDKIGFLKWVELSQEAIAELELYDNPDRVFLSPDVHSLHLVWTIKSDNAVQHEIADYPDRGATLVQFLEDEIMDDAWETFVSVDVDNIYTEFLSTHSDETAETVKVVSLTDLS